MAVLNKIRQRSIFLIAIIALALFAFVLSDLFRNSTAFSGSQDIVATIDGEELHREDFMGKVEMAQRQLGPNVTSTQAMNRVWDQEVRKIVLQKQFEKLGLTVEKDQMRELLKQNLSGIPDFSNEVGMFDENKLNEFIANLKAISPQRAPLGNSMINYQEWVSSEKSIAVTGQQQSYFNMIKAGVSGTIGEAELEYDLENATADIKYAMVPYTSISDSLVTVSKSDISAYINKHKKQYETEATRDIVFVQFEENASLQDEEDVKRNVLNLMGNTVEYNNVSKLNDTLLGFRDTQDIEGFINTYSDVKFDDAYVKKEALPTVAADTLAKLGPGSFYGPYKDAGMYKITKVLAEKNLPDSVKARHILIPFLGSRSASEETKQTEAQAKATADSIMAVVKTDRKKFVSLLDFSADKVSNEKEGVLDWYAYNAMVPEFRDYTFENKTGDIGVVKTDFGFHVIEILGQTGTSKLYKVATLAQKIEPSEKTIDDVFNAVSNFEIAIQDKDFQDVAKEKDLTVRPVNGIKELDENIPGLGSQRVIVRWAFEDGTKVGNTKRFSVPSGGYVVAQVTAVNKKGLMSVESASATALPEIRKEKKAKMIREKIAGKDMEAIAKEQGQTPTTVPAVNMKSPTLSGAGLEPKVVGTAFGLKEGQTSKLIDGEKGVFLVSVVKRTEAPKLDNYQSIVNRLTSTRGNAVQTKAYEALKEAADIDDQRANFY
ncbi:MAG TPA: SurA N-terminal domain-containing protein [Aquaticitalea sp.]|nr:SurA N-terminal domain-containing protein [Aquaticitalea sp.]HNU58600.1 SurA N-terminal domain-containing protein [Aquaticitalea sp.]